MADDPGDGWARLAPETRREVLRLAREGRPHPDPKVRAAAAAWAAQVLAQPLAAWLPALGVAVATGLVAAGLLNLVVGSGAVVRLVGLPVAALVGAAAGLTRRRARAAGVARANRPPDGPPSPG